MNLPRITVVIPAYNHQQFIAETVRSVLQQNCPELELHILDDGSADATFEAAKQATSNIDHVKCLVERQENRGSSTTLNRLIERLDSDYVAILNSDDLYAPGRLQAFLQKAEGEDLFFGISGVRFLENGSCNDLATFEQWYASKLEVCARLPTCGFAQLTGNLAVTSSNFFFSREIFDLVGGFDPALQLTQDWDFSIKALRWVEPTLLPEKLMTYRIHPSNTWRRLAEVRREQCERVLQDYAGWAKEICPNRLAPVPQHWPRFFPFFARSCGTLFSEEAIANSLPEALLEQAKAGDRAVSSDLGALRDLMIGSTEDRHVISLETVAQHWQSVRDRQLSNWQALKVAT